MKRAVVLAAALATACDSRSADLAGLARAQALWSSELLTVVAPADLETTRLAQLGRELERRGRWQVRFATERAAVREGACVWIVDQRSAGIGEFAQLNGVVFESTGAFWFGGERYAAPGDGVRLSVSDPERPDVPLQVFLGPTAALAAELVESLEPQTSPGWIAMRAGQVSGDSRGRAIVGAALPSVANSTEPLADLDERGLLWRAPADAPPALLAEYRQRVAAVRTRIETWFGAPAAQPRLELLVWPDLDAFAAASGACELRARGFAPGQVHALLSSDGLDDGGGGLARALARALAGQPSEDWVLDAFELLASRSWMGAPLEQALELAATRPLSLEQSLRPSSRASPHRFQPLRALALELALEGLDSDALREHWRRGGFEARIDPARFEREVLARAEAGAGRLAARRAHVLGDLSPLSGVHLNARADRDGRRGVGYGSRACLDALRTLAGMGAGAVVLAPRAYLTDDRRHALLRAPSEPFASSASDAALCLAMLQARKLGMKVVLAPQLWSAPSGGLASARQAPGELDSEQLLTQSNAMVEHYALLAELAGAEVLCVGGRAMWLLRTQATPPVRAAWQDGVSAARASFFGALTYLALFDGEAHHFEAWSEFDLISVALAQDLTHASFDGKRPSERGVEAVLRGQLRTLHEWAAPFSKPLWLLQVGYAPTTEAWLDPRAALGGYDTQQQAELLRAFDRALKAQRASDAAPAGVFFWNWSTDAEHGNAVDRSFTLQNRPAAELLPELLRRP